VLTIDTEELARPAAVPSRAPAVPAPAVPPRSFPVGNLAPGHRDRSLSTALKLLAAAPLRPSRRNARRPGCPA